MKAIVKEAAKYVGISTGIALGIFCFVGMIFDLYYGGNFSLSGYQFTKMVVGCVVVGWGFGVPAVVYRKENMPCVNMAGIYDKASYAIQKAQQISGVVISSDQKYVWEKGNRDLAYSIEDVTLSKEGEETSLEACERYMKTYDAQKVDLTGCTLDQVLYVINRGCPVIALTSADHAILLTGYTKNDITYIDPENGESQTVSISEMEGMVSGSGNTFIGYIK